MAPNTLLEVTQKSNPVMHLSNCNECSSKALLNSVLICQNTKTFKFYIQLKVNYLNKYLLYECRK